jgi:hypothetical protein
MINIITDVRSQIKVGSLFPHYLNSFYYYTNKLEFYHMGMGLSYGIDSQTSALDNSISSAKCNAQTARHMAREIYCPLFTTLNMA